MSKNNSKNKILNYNIGYSNMTSKRTLEQKTEHLKREPKKVKNEDHKQKVDNLTQLYKDRKLSRITTVESQINKFINYDSFKPRKQKTVNKQYETLADKYKDEETLAKRMKDNKYSGSLEIKNEDSAKTEVIFTNKQIGMDFDGLRNFLSLHNKKYGKLYEKVLKIVKQKKSVKVKTTCEYQWKSGAQEKDKLQMKCCFISTWWFWN